MSRIGGPAAAATTLLLAVAPVAPASAATTASDRAAVHIDAGAASAGTAGGTAWAADAGFTGGTVSVWSGATGTDEPARYGTVRYGMSAYDIPVPAGRYDVTLHMVEPWHDGPRERVFDVAVEGATVLDDFDLFAAAGGQFKAYDRTFRADVTGDTLDIDFDASVNYAIVSSISVVPVDTREAARPAPATPVAPAAAALEGYPFGATSVWRQDISRAPLHGDSGDIVRHLTRSVTSRYDGTAAFNAREYNAAYYVAAATTRRTTVKYNNCQGKDNTYGLYDGPSHFVDVPIPADAVPAKGSDRSLSIYSPSSDQLWEFWNAEKRSDGWYACWGGRIDSVSTNPGHFEGNYGATATGLPHAGGQIRLADVQSGSIEHAVALLLAEPRSRKVVSWPAQRSDGWVDDADAVPEGLRLRLDPSVDVESLGLHPVAEMIAVAAQKYGFVAVDASGATGVYAEGGAAQQAKTGVDPWKELLDGTPTYAVMEDFPWDKLQALPVSYGKP